MVKRRTVTAWRKGLTTKVKIGQKAMGMTDEAYRDMLMDRYEASSCTELSIPQLENLVDHFAALGVEYPDSRKKYAKKDPAKFYEIPDADPDANQKRYLLAMYKALGWNVAGIDKRCKLQFGVERFLWLHDQNHLQILARDLIKRCKKKGIDPSPERLGL